MQLCQSHIHLSKFLIYNPIMRGCWICVMWIGLRFSGVRCLSTHFFTCRHSYETTLMDELQQISQPKHLSSPYPGLVEAEMLDSKLLDPVYALGVLPNAHQVQAESIQGLAKACMENLTSNHNHLLRGLPKASLAVHAFVPDCFKGSPKPRSHRRVLTVADSVIKQLQGLYPCARPDLSNSSPQALLQLLLLEPQLLLVSLSTVTCSSVGVWPHPYLVAGLANAEESLVLAHDPRRAPSSAYRKLLEALSCIQFDSAINSAVDLGASPGGWTSVLCKLGVKSITAVDRATLDTPWANHPGVEFFKSDAFQYTPSKPVDIMVSDLICFPERTVELLETWCRGELATRMIITMKFKGDSPHWGALEHAKATAQSYGYKCRAKHFFNNKNEVTLILAKSHDFAYSKSSLYQSMYPLSLPN